MKIDSFKSNFSTLFALFVLSSWIFLALIPQVFPSLREIDINLPMTRNPPVLDWRQPFGWFGFDSVGASIFLHVVNGARVSLLVGSATVLGSLLIGVPLGALAGYKGGLFDAVVGRIIDVLLAFPPLVLPLSVAAFFGGGMSTVIFALCLGAWIVPAKIVRAQFRSLKTREYVLAAVALGASPTRIMFRHLLPQTFTSLMVHATFTMAGAILAEASLSFLGLGLGGEHTSWGGLLNDARAYLIESPHMAIFPALAMLSLLLSLNILGESLRRAQAPVPNRLGQGD